MDLSNDTPICLNGSSILNPGEYINLRQIRHDDQIPNFTLVFEKGTNVHQIEISTEYAEDIGFINVMALQNALSSNKKPIKDGVKAVLDEALHALEVFSEELDLRYGDGVKSYQVNRIIQKINNILGDEKS